MLFVAFNYTMMDYEISGYQNVTILARKPEDGNDIKKLERQIMAAENRGKDLDAGEGFDSVTILSFQEL